jgi:hypothetical protein
MAQVDQYLARFGLQQQGVGDAAKRLLRGESSRALKGIAP